MIIQQFRASNAKHCRQQKRQARCLSAHVDCETRSRFVDCRVCHRVAAASSNVRWRASRVPPRRRRASWCRRHRPSRQPRERRYRRPQLPPLLHRVSCAQSATPKPTSSPPRQALGCENRELTFSAPTLLHMTSRRTQPKAKCVTANLQTANSSARCKTSKHIHARFCRQNSRRTATTQNDYELFSEYFARHMLKPLFYKNL